MIGSVDYPPDFSWPALMTEHERGWLITWCERLGRCHLALCKIVQEPNADGGLALAFVLDLAVPVSRADEAQALAPFNAQARPEAFPDHAAAGAFRYVLATDWPRFQSYARGTVPPLSKEFIAALRGALEPPF